MRRMTTVAVTIATVLSIGCVPDPGSPPETTTTTSTSTSTSTSTTSTSTSTVAPELAITASDPASPASSMTPRLTGIAPAGTTIVRVFAGAGCTGAVWGGDLATFTGSGIEVSVGMGATTSFTAYASGPGVTTGCSAPFEYVNTLIAPNITEDEPNGTLAEANPVLVDVGQPAEIAGHLDGLAGIYPSDLFTFHVDAGRSIRIETFDATAAACAMTDTQIYLAPLGAGLGGNDDNSGIDFCSLLAPGVGVYGANLVNVAGGAYLLTVKGIPLGGAYRVRVEVFQ